MHFVIVGCGRVGAMLAESLEDAGGSVAIIDHDPEAFRRLDPGFSGRTVTGVGFDRETLVAAGVVGADAFAAVSDGDNSNIIAARVVREEFDVQRVVARIYDPRRAELYERLGIPTVATVRWTTEQVLRRLLPGTASREYVDPTGRVSLVRVDVHPSWVGTALTQLEQVTGGRIAFLTRAGIAEVPRPGGVLQEGDDLHLLLDTARITTVGNLLAAPRGT